MRVIAGSAKGRTLKGPPTRRRGERSTGARPSSDLVRGALFSALDALEADFTRVLDLYAGTGALGIEALSRGAEWCDFVERDRAMSEVIRENLRLTSFDTSSKVYPLAASRAMERLAGTYTLVLADPPYADSDARGILDDFARSELVDPENTTIVLEHGARDEPAGDLGPFHLHKVLRHGDSAVSIYTPAAEQRLGGESC
jgi:16S rRNA (guanine966-N2)-methyltransferase